MSIILTTETEGWALAKHIPSPTKYRTNKQYATIIHDHLSDDAVTQVRTYRCRTLDFRHVAMSLRLNVPP
jgi:hypothetical protein